MEDKEEEVEDKYPITYDVHPLAAICLILIAIVVMVIATIYTFERDAYCDELKMQEQQMMTMESQNDGN